MKSFANFFVKTNIFLKVCQNSHLLIIRKIFIKIFTKSVAKIFVSIFGKKFERDFCKNAKTKISVSTLAKNNAEKSPSQHPQHPALQHENRRGTCTPSSRKK
jgi:hypothetical protein